jgi:hypothetical protein
VTSFSVSEVIQGKPLTAVSFEDTGFIKASYGDTNLDLTTDPDLAIPGMFELATPDMLGAILPTIHAMVEDAVTGQPVATIKIPEGLLPPVLVPYTDTPPTLQS